MVADSYELTATSLSTQYSALSTIFPASPLQFLPTSSLANSQTSQLMKVCPLVLPVMRQIILKFPDQ